MKVQRAKTVSPSATIGYNWILFPAQVAPVSRGVCADSAVDFVKAV
jgi:hypothetical protein